MDLRKIRLLAFVLWSLPSCFNYVSSSAEFSEIQAFQCRTAPGAIALADVNGDGFSDLFVDSYQSAKLSIYLNSGFGVFATSPVQVLPVFAASIFVKDFDNGGTNDLAVQEDVGISLWRSLGDGTFKFAERVETNSYGLQGDLVAADLDGDGWMDLISAQPTERTMRIFMNTGKGEFHPENRLPIK